MGMTIDDCIDYYNRSYAIGDTDDDRQHNDILEMTIETMRKYQNIEEIMHIEMNGKEALQEIERILRG